MRIGITGCAGRMGRMLAEAVLASPGCVLAGGSERPDHPAIGSDLGTLLGRPPRGVVVSNELIDRLRDEEGIRCVRCST